MQTARDLIRVLVKFSAGMKLGHDHFGGRNALALVNIGRDAAAIIGDGDRTIGIEGYANLGRITAQGLINGIIDHFINHVVQARAVIRIANIHARALAHRI